MKWRNTLRFEQTAQRKFLDDNVIPWIAASKSSDQKLGRVGNAPLLNILQPFL